MHSYRIAANNVKQMQDWLLGLTTGITCESHFVQCCEMIWPARQLHLPGDRRMQNGPQDKHVHKGGEQSSGSMSTAVTATAQPAPEPQAEDEAVVYVPAGDGEHYFKQFPE